jgi:hypothetical protein
MLDSTVRSVPSTSVRPYVLKVTWSITLNFHVAITLISVHNKSLKLNMWSLVSGWSIPVTVGFIVYVAELKIIRTIGKCFAVGYTAG